VISRSDPVEESWPIRLFRKSVLKQQKFREIAALLGDADQLHCLDIGSDNGVISHLLRRRGGIWKSADLDETAVHSIRELVTNNVFQINGRTTPFRDNEFDRVVIIDFLEHIWTDKEFIDELFRVTKPGGELIINVPHVKNSLLRRFRLAIGQTDEKHGHVRQGYTLDSLNLLLEDRFMIVSHKTYSKLFSECIDTLIRCRLHMLKRGEALSTKGIVVTREQLSRYRNSLRLYSVIRPLVSCVAKLDALLFWCSGYMLIVKAKSCNKGACEYVPPRVVREVK